MKNFAVTINVNDEFRAYVRGSYVTYVFQLRQLRPFTRSLTTEAAKTLVQAFISCRLDYCNSLLYGVTDNVMRRVQSLQNAAARLITGARRRDHITPVLCQLHWLPVRWRVEFGAPRIVRSNAYLSGWWHPPRLPRQPTIPSFFLLKQVRTTALETEALVLRIWNCLPCGRRTLDISYKHFKALLKTYMFRQGHGALWHSI